MNLAFSLQTYQRRVERTLASLETEGLEALIVNMPDNINYLCGFDSIGYLWYQALVVSPALDAPVFFTRTTEEPCTWETSAVQDARFYDISTTDPIDMVADLLVERGLGDRRIGVEMQAFTLLPAQWERLKDRLPEAQLVDASTLVAELRLVKSAREIDYQRKAARMADAAMKACFEALRPGISEVELAGVASGALAAAGSEYAAIPPMVTSGPRSTMIHGMASRRSIGDGDVVIIELAGTCRRYHGVLMRTAVLGEPSVRLQQISDCMRQAMRASLTALEPGAKPGAANHACNAVTDRLGISANRAHRIGYSLGIAYPPTWLEAMILDDPDPHTVAAGMSFTIEPNLSFYEEGFGYKVGDTVLVTEQGSQSFSELDHGLLVVR